MSLPKKVQDQIAKAGLPTCGPFLYIPRLTKNKRGNTILDKARVEYGPREGKKGYVDTEGRIWIRDRAHAEVGDHWDVQIDGGRDYINVGLDGHPLV